MGLVPRRIERERRRLRLLDTAALDMEVRHGARRALTGCRSRTWLYQLVEHASSHRQVIGENHPAKLLVAVTPDRPKQK